VPIDFDNTLSWRTCVFTTTFIAFIAVFIVFMIVGLFETATLWIAIKLSLLCASIVSGMVMSGLTVYYFIETDVEDISW
jgi:hypothetical protein